MGVANHVRFAATGPVEAFGDQHCTGRIGDLGCLSFFPCRSLGASGEAESHQVAAARSAVTSACAVGSPVPITWFVLFRTRFGLRLRAVEAFPVEHEGRRVIALRDPSGYTESVVLLLGAGNHRYRLRCVVDGKLYVSVADGTMYRLSGDGSAWEKVGVATPRIVISSAPPDISWMSFRITESSSVSLFQLP